MIAVPCYESVLREAKPRALVQEARYARFFLSLGRGKHYRPAMLRVSIARGKASRF